MRRRILRVIMLSIFIVAAIILITHFTESKEIDKQTAKLICFWLNG